jgi:3-oxoadipate enol-lactonase
MKKQIRGADLHTIDSGDGIPVIWIHGFPLGSELFAEQLAIGGVRHIVPDLPGFGKSPAPNSDFSMADYADSVLDLATALGIDRAVFAGVSMGGYIVFEIARHAPERVRGLILIDTREAADAPDARENRLRTADEVRQKGISIVVDSMLPKMLTAATLGADGRAAGIARRIMSASSPAGVIAALHAMAARPDSSALLPSIAVPVLVVAGESDSITPPADAQRMAAAIPNAELAIVPDAAHLSNLERPDFFNRAVEGFLDRHFGRSAAGPK